MTTNNACGERAKGKLRLVMERMINSYPFHVKLLERLVLVARPDVDTMGVTVDGDAVLLLLNPEFIVKTTAEELTGILLHEVHHLLFRHVFADPQDYPDLWARTVAEEVTANEFIAELLPDGALRLEDFPDLPAMESTAERYRRLQQVTARMPLVSPREFDIASAKMATASPACGSAPEKTRSKTLDDHDVWQQTRREANRSAAAVETIVQEAAMEVAGKLPEYVQRTLRSSYGTTPSARERNFDHQAIGRLDWRRLLWRFASRVAHVRPVFSWPPRRFPQLLGRVPGNRRRADRPKIMAVIDTSGSITDRLLAMIDAELRRLARHFDVLVVECDCEVHAVYKYTPLRIASGGGGTDLRPPFAKDLLGRTRPDLIVYFTDGFGPAPERPPGLPVVWCLVPGGKKPAPWGLVVHISEEETISDLESS